MKILYISDLDGTLLDSGAKLPRDSCAELNVLISQGLNFTYATARSWTSASKIMRSCNLALPAITYNGAFIVKPDSGDIIRAFTLDDEKFAFILSAIEKFNLSPLVYSFIDGAQRVMWVKGRETDGIRNCLNARPGDKRFMGVDSLQDLNNGQIYYVTIIGTQSELAPLAAIIEDEKVYSSVFSKDIYTGEYWLEICDERASKATGVEWLRKNYGFDRIVCFGDNLNDIPMFKAADEAYAVENAASELKLIADDVIGSNEENAVVEFIKNHTKGEKWTV